MFGAWRSHPRSGAELKRMDRSAGSDDRRVVCRITAQLYIAPATAEDMAQVNRMENPDDVEAFYKTRSPLRVLGFLRFLATR